MTLRFYRGGPEAFGRLYGSHWHSVGGECGCFIAERVGAVIPINTYYDSEPGLSQGIDPCGKGINLTALLPLEDEDVET